VVAIIKNHDSLPDWKQFCDFTDARDHVVKRGHQQVEKHREQVRTYKPFDI
jgi:hypothetical protein